MAAMDNEQFALVTERDFLLRSLSDLDDERDAGNIDAEQYAILHADYTARCAVVLRAIAGTSSGAGSNKSSQLKAQGDSAQEASARRRRFAVWVGVVAFAVVTAVSLSFAMGARLPGQFVTGPAPSGSAGGASLAALEAAVKKNPADIEAHRSLARAYLSQQRYADGLKEFDEVVKLAPKDTEAHAYGGWILRLAGLPDDGLVRIERALEIDSSYPDAHFFKGIIYLRDKSNPSAAIPEFQLYLAAVPDGGQSAAVRQLLAQAVAATSGGVSSTTSP